MLSVIIPITGKNRYNHANMCIHFLRQQKFKDLEIILVEQINCLLGNTRTGGPFYNTLQGIDKYISIFGPGKNHFNQPWMANVGSRIAKGNKFLFYDIDIICEDSYLQFVHEFNPPYFIAWHKMFSLSKEDSLIINKTKVFNESIVNNSEMHSAGTLAFAGFSTCVTKEFFFDILGGYNENYLGWGGNDNDIAWRALKILGKEFILKHRLFHLWHSKEYAKAMFWERRGTWLTTYKHPEEITKRLKYIKIGKISEPTFIDIKDIWIDPIKEQLKKKDKK